MGCPYSEHGGEAAFPGYCVLHTCSRRGGRHHHDGHDEATRWWFGQAGRQRPSRAHCGLSATATTPSQGGRETTPPAVHWSVRERSNGRQGCRKCSANIFHGATRGSRVAVSRHQVQRGPTDAVPRLAAVTIRCACLFRAGILDGHNTRIVPEEIDASGTERAACDLMCRNEPGRRQRRVRRPWAE